MFNFKGENRIPISHMLIDQFEYQERERIAAINKRWERYHGTFPDLLAKTELDSKAEDNTKVNFTRKTVDVSAFYLFGKNISFEVDGKTEDTTADEWLDSCWQSQTDGKMPLLLEFATAGGVAGDGYLRVFLPDKSIGEVYPRIVALDSVNIQVIWEVSDFNRVRQYKITWNAVDPDTNKLIVYRHLITNEGTGWRIEEQESVGDNPQFTTTANIRWPYRWCPVFHCKNRPLPHSFFGTSDVENDALHLNEKINFVFSNINRILRAHGHPFQYVTGQRVEEIDRSIGVMPYFPNENAKVQSVEMISELVSSFSQLKELKQAYHELTSIPEVATGKLESVGQLSGLALQILYGPLVALTTVKRMLYGTMLERLCVALLEIGGISAKTVKIQWPAILPIDRKSEADTAITLQSAGVSKDTTIAELGYDASVEEEKRRWEGVSIAEQTLAAFDRGQA